MLDLGGSRSRLAECHRGRRMHSWCAVRRGATSVDAEAVYGISYAQVCDDRVNRRNGYRRRARDTSRAEPATVAGH